MPDYPSNISRAQFALIQPDLENFRKHTRPRRYDLYDVFNAILYSLTTGCQWRELPHDFPEWHTVYRYYDVWRDKPDPTADSLLERLLKNSFLAILRPFIYIYTKAKIKSPQKTFKGLNNEARTIHNIFLSFLQNISV